MVLCWVVGWISSFYSLWLLRGVWVCGFVGWGWWGFGLVFSYFNVYSFIVTARVWGVLCFVLCW